MKGRPDKLKIFITIFAALIVALQSNFCSATYYSVSYGRCYHCGAEIYLIIRYTSPMEIIRDDRYTHCPQNGTHAIVWQYDGQLYWYDERTGQWTRM